MAVPSSGANEGMSVGIGVGEVVGGFVGELDGVGVGSNVGDLVGALVGENVGDDDGADVVGCIVISTVGSVPGRVTLVKFVESEALDVGNVVSVGDAVGISSTFSMTVGEPEGRSESDDSHPSSCSIISSVPMTNSLSMA